MCDWLELVICCEQSPRTGKILTKVKVKGESNANREQTRINGNSMQNDKILNQTRKLSFDVVTYSHTHTFGLSPNDFPVRLESELIRQNQVFFAQMQSAT